MVKQLKLGVVKVFMTSAVLNVKYPYINHKVVKFNYWTTPIQKNVTILLYPER